MSDLPFMPLWVAKYDARTAHLTLEEDGAYMRLLRLSWVSPKCQIPDNDAWIMRMMRVDEPTYQRVVQPVLSEFFYKADGAYRNAKLREVYQAKTHIHNVRVEAGRVGGQNSARKKREKRTNGASAHDEAPKEQEASMPEPEAISRKPSKLGFSMRVRESIGDAWKGAHSQISLDHVHQVVCEWLDLGASEAEIINTVSRQTEHRRDFPIYSLRALQGDIETVIAARKPRSPNGTPEPLDRPPGRAGECLDAIVARYGEVQTAAWLQEAEWTESEVVLPTEFNRDNVRKRFAAILGDHGFTAVARTVHDRKTA